MIASIVTVMMLAAPATPAETAWRACIDRTKTNFDWSQCGQRYIAQADAALNVQWRRLMAVTKGQARADLITEERAWIAYRQSACRFYMDGDLGREGQVLGFPSCVAGAIERRTADLAGYRAALEPQ